MANLCVAILTFVQALMTRLQRLVDALPAISKRCHAAFMSDPVAAVAPSPIPSPQLPSATLQQSQPISDGTIGSRSDHSGSDKPNSADPIRLSPEVVLVRVLLFRYPVYSILVLICLYDRLWCDVSSAKWRAWPLTQPLLRWLCLSLRAVRSAASAVPDPTVATGDGGR